ncbi:putative secreted chitinase [Trichinella spiralis]|uniref:putative secreted chitinase n=1 Tax=Trichinella spiralis TaxID=6334 RepID=UPI0001EFE7A7|nr:putative secreted chitinase [Trichinella spiralis]
MNGLSDEMLGCVSVSRTLDQFSLDGRHPAIPSSVCVRARVFYPCELMCCGGGGGGDLGGGLNGFGRFEASSFVRRLEHIHPSFGRLASLLVIWQKDVLKRFLCSDRRRQVLGNRRGIK